MKVPDIRFNQGLVAFGAVLIVALAISWWSLYSLAMTFYGVPKPLAIGVSIAFDGAALFVADLASKYARTEDSGMAAKLATYLFIGISTYLNVEHAILLGYGIPGMVLFGAPPVIAGILFELYLRFVHRAEMRRNGLVPKRMPVFGKMAWMMFPKKTWDGLRKVVLSRLNDVVTSNVTSGDKVTKQVTRRSDNVTKVSPTMSPPSDKKVTGDIDVTSDVTSQVTKVTHEGDKVTLKIGDINGDMSVSSLVRALFEMGVTERGDIIKRVSDIKGQAVSPNTVTKAMSRVTK